MPGPGAQARRGAILAAQRGGHAGRAVIRSRQSTRRGARFAISSSGNMRSTIMPQWA
jgi:hypothetical protein